MLALWGHKPDDASPEARAGALLVAEHQALLNAFVKGISKAFGAKTQQSTADRMRGQSRIRR